jgi:hypothetical protein
LTRVKVEYVSIKNYFYLFPDKAPSWFKTKAYCQKEEKTEEEDIEPKSKDINLYLDRPKSTSKISKSVLINRAKAKKAITQKEQTKARALEEQLDLEEREILDNATKDVT